MKKLKMNSKEALDILFMTCNEDLLLDNYNILFAHHLTEIVKKDLEQLKKIKKAIEIIKDKTKMYLDEDYLVLGVPYDVFEDLTQEEYDLLKEVLEDE